MSSRFSLCCGGLAAASLLVAPAAAQSPATPDTTRRVRILKVTIPGRDSNELFTAIPGSVSSVSAKEIRLLASVSSNEVFRRVPGLNVMNEEGVGLRANVGIWGLDPAVAHRARPQRRHPRVPGALRRAGAVLHLGNRPHGGGEST